MTSIRQAILEDAAAIARVHVEAWRTAYRGVLADHFLNGLSEEARRSQWHTALSSRRPGEFTVVAEQNKQVIGFVNGGPERKGDPQFSGEVFAIYLLDDFRGQGTGTALFRRAVETLLKSGTTSMKVWVLRDNPYRCF